jgi:hypothetical protein
VTAWFKARSHITLIKWPGNSPDLNPIGNAWNLIKYQLKNTNCIKEWKGEIKRL